ncbi:hypothetical protein IT400_00030 [Candidatus Nomurabacteria bacterium]|nr:hypothetical protein [Candidatus Nomurabacteria bacterium]
MYIDQKLEASFSDLIISHLLSCRSIKIQRQVLYELVQKKKKKNRQVFLNNLHRLNKKGIIGFKDNNILINRKEVNKYFLFRNIKTKPTGDTQILVLFDIPEKQRKIRNWLRLQLKLWDFKMIQQSAWVGDGPLPKEFVDHIKLLNIKNCVKVFKLSK